MNLQDLERDPDLRIKFASIMDDGSFDVDGVNYDCLFGETVLEGWEVIETPKLVEVRDRGMHRAWQISDGKTQLGAVEHETGLELLAVLGVGTASNVASAGIVSMATWAWSRWKKLRGEKPLELSLVLEGVVKRAHNGKPSVVVRQELRGPLEADAVGESLEDFLQRRIQIHQGETTNRGLKLAAVAIALAVVEIVTLFLLLENGGSLDQSATVFGVVTLLYRPWVLAILGGALGGTARSFYAFLVQVRAFEIKRTTGHSYSGRSLTAGGNPAEEDYDWMRVWYLYLIKPLIGAAMGFLFALLIGFGLIPLLSQTAGDAETIGIVLISALAGLFGEDAMRGIRGLFRRQQPAQNAG